MSVTTLLDQFPLLAGASEGVKRLRELILELAVRGKLVPQDPNDEPASELLKRIQAEKAKLVAEGKIKKDKLLPEIGEDEKPFELPAGWEWTRLATVSIVNPRNDVVADTEASFVPMAMIGTQFDGVHQQEIRKWGEIKQGFTHFAEGDVGVAKITPCFENSKACVFSGLKNGIGAGTTELHIVRPIADTLAPRYVLTYLKAPMFLKVGEAKMTGTAGQKRLPKDFVETNSFPLPPLPEQHRIVAKVDELMALCDRLEAQQSDAASAHATLVKTLLDTLTAPGPLPDSVPAPRPDRFSKPVRSEPTHWQRIAQHFDTLFTTEASIAALKQTILQLAVMGKLVPQDPNDEPASELLKRIQAEKAKLVAEGKIKKDKPLPGIGEDEKPFELPAGWEWARLGNISHAITKGATPTTYGHAYQNEGINFVKVENITEGRIARDSISQFISEEADEMLSRSRLAEGDILFSIAGTIGKTCLVVRDDLPANTNQALAIIKGTAPAFQAGYLIVQLDSLVGDSTRERARGGAMNNVSLGDLTELVVTLPPFAEQHRIVAKVDELMALCDQLAACLKAARELAAHYATAATVSALEAA